MAMSKAKRTKSRVIYVMVSSDVHAKWKAAAVKRGITLRALVSDAVEASLVRVAPTLEERIASLEARMSMLESVADPCLAERRKL